MELSGRKIEDMQFSKSRRGYDREEVDRFITECAAYVGNLEERMKISEVRANANEDELATLRTNIDVLLEEATEARRKIIEEAKAEAGVIVSYAPTEHADSEVAEAASKAAAILAEAETAAKLRLESVDEVLHTARDQADSIVRNGEETAALTQAEADRVLDKARMDANSIRKEAEATQASMNAQLAEIRRLLSAARLGDAESVAPPAHPSDSELVIDLREPAADPESQQVTG